MSVQVAKDRYGELPLGLLHHLRPFALFRLGVSSALAVYFVPVNDVEIGLWTYD